MDKIDEEKENGQPWVTVSSIRKRENKQTKTKRQPASTDKKTGDHRQEIALLSPHQPPKQPTTINTGNQPQQSIAQLQTQPVTLPNNISSNNKQIKFLPIILHENTIEQKNMYTQQKNEKILNYETNKQQQKNVKNTNNKLPQNTCEILKLNKLYIHTKDKRNQTILLNDLEGDFDTEIVL